MAMSRSQVRVKWYFKKVKLQWKLVDFKCKLHVKEAAVGSLYITGVLLANFRKYVYLNPISQYFNSLSVSLEDYVAHQE